MNYMQFVKSDWPIGFRHDYKPNARQAVVMEATQKAMEIMKNSDGFDGCYYISTLVKKVMKILGCPEGHEYVQPSEDFNVENGRLGYDVYNSTNFIQATQYHEQQAAIMCRLVICKGQRVGVYKEPFGQLRRNIVIDEIYETGVLIHFTQGNKRYKQTINASNLEAILKANMKDEPSISFDESPLEALLNDL